MSPKRLAMKKHAPFSPLPWSIGVVSRADMIGGLQPKFRGEKSSTPPLTLNPTLGLPMSMSATDLLSLVPHSLVTPFDPPMYSTQLSPAEKTTHARIHARTTCGTHTRSHTRIAWSNGSIQRNRWRRSLTFDDNNSHTTLSHWDWD